MGSTATTADVVVDKDLHQRIKVQAAIERRSVKAIMDELLRAYLAEKAQEAGVQR